MGLSCSCGEWEGEGIGYYPPEDFTTLETSKRKRCQSCKMLIDLNNPVLKFKRMRAPQTDIEVRIYGDDGEIYLCDHYLCSGCGEKYLNLEDLGYCLDPSESMEKYMDEYHEISGFKKEA